MASHYNKVIKSLIRYGNTSAVNRVNLTTWHTEAINEKAANKGGQIATGSTNGASFGLHQGATIDDWLAQLEEALDHIERGTRPTTRTYASLGNF